MNKFADLNFSKSSQSFCLINVTESMNNRYSSKKWVSKPILACMFFSFPTIHTVFGYDDKGAKKSIANDKA
jgi:hypothetical protein